MSGTGDALALGRGQSAAELWRAQRELGTGRAAGSDQRVAALSRRVSAGQAALGGPVFCVPIVRLAGLERDIDRLARRCQRLGIAPISLRDTGERAGERAFVVIVGEPPRLAGWEVAAIIVHRGGGAALRPTTAVGERVDPGLFAEARCAHCEVRRRRVRTFVLVETSSGQLRQVGTSCLRDFLGGHDPERLCRGAEYLSLARETLGRVDGPATETGPSPLEELAAHAAHAVRAHGWVARERARRSGEPTSAERAVASWRAEPWLPAIELASGHEVVGARDCGLLCALIAVYRQRRARSTYVGPLGAVLEVTVLVERAAAGMSRRYGTVRRYDLLDADADRLVWWQTRGTALSPGQVVRIRGRVVRHTRFRGTPVTVLAYCRAKNEAIAAPCNTSVRENAHAPRQDDHD